MDLSPLYQTYSRIEKIGFTTPVTGHRYLCQHELRFSVPVVLNRLAGDLNFNICWKGNPFPIMRLSPVSVLIIWRHAAGPCLPTWMLRLGSGRGASLKNLFIDGTKINLLPINTLLSGRRVSRNGSRGQIIEQNSGFILKTRNSLASKCSIHTLSIGTIYGGCWGN